MEKTGQGELAPLYLVTGERSLCLAAVDRLLALLFPGGKGREQGVRRISGEKEDIRETMGLLRTVSMFSDRTVVLVDDSRLFKSKNVAEKVWERVLLAHQSGNRNRARGAILGFLAIGGVSPSEIDALSESQWQELFGFPRPDTAILAEMAQVVAGAELPENLKGEDELADWVEAGGPGGNILIVVTPEVDRRKALYKFFSKKAAVIDLGVDKGAGKAAKESRRAIVRQVVKKGLSAVNKRFAPRAEQLLIDRVGFHPEALAVEIEKLALYDPDSPEISLETVKNEVAANSEHAIFELTEAFFAGRLTETLHLLKSLLESSMHPLAIIAGLRNQARKLLAASELAKTAPGYSPGMSFAAFQKSCLPGLKESGIAPDVTKGHPYVVYNLISRAAALSPWRLIAVMDTLMECEMGLKGSGIDGEILLFATIFKALTPKARA